MVEKEEIGVEEFLKGIRKVREYLSKSPVDFSLGSKNKPYEAYFGEKVYNEFEPFLDEHNMINVNGTWFKIHKVPVLSNSEKNVIIQVKPYEVKKEYNSFCNTFKEPFYHDLFKQNNSAYAVKVLGKWKKK